MSKREQFYDKRCELLCATDVNDLDAVQSAYYSMKELFVELSKIYTGFELACITADFNDCENAYFEM